MVTDSRFSFAETEEERKKRRIQRVLRARSSARRVLLAQSSIAILVLGWGFALRSVPFWGALIMYTSANIVLAFLGIHHSVDALRAQKKAQREEPGLPGPIGPWPILGAMIGALFWTIILGASFYINSFWSYQLSG